MEPKEGGHRLGVYTQAGGEVAPGGPWVLHMSGELVAGVQGKISH